MGADAAVGCWGCSWQPNLLCHYARFLSVAEETEKWSELGRYWQGTALTASQQCVTCLLPLFLILLFLLLKINVPGTASIILIVPPRNHL